MTTRQSFNLVLTAFTISGYSALAAPVCEYFVPREIQIIDSSLVTSGEGYPLEAVRSLAINRCRKAGYEDCNQIKENWYYGNNTYEVWARGFKYRYLKYSQEERAVKICDKLDQCEQNFLADPAATTNDLEKLNYIMIQNQCRKQ
jgi:hypothetical protein